MLCLFEKQYVRFFSSQVLQIILLFLRPSIDETFYRGCMKDETEGRHLCEQNAAKCEVCDENACNSEMKWEMNAGDHFKSKFIYCFSLFTITMWIYPMI